MSRVQRTLFVGAEVWDGSGFVPSDVLVERDVITTVSPRATLLPGAPDADLNVIDCQDHLLIPGLTNAHTHAQNMLVRGLMDIGALEALFSNGRAQSLGRTPEETYLAAALNAIEMAKGGVTASCEQINSLPTPSAEHISAAAQAYADVGLRTTIAPIVSDRSMYEFIPGLLESLPVDLRESAKAAQPAYPDLRVIRNAIESYKHHSRIRIGVSPMMPLLCSDRLLRELVDLATGTGAMFYTHVAETRLQARAYHQRFGKSVVELLADVGGLGERSVLAHAVWLTDRDLDLVADSNSLVAHNPASNMRLGSGIARIFDMLSRGIRVGIGTDGSASSDNQNMFEAMRIATLLSRVVESDDRRWLEAGTVFEMAIQPHVSFTGMTDRGLISPGHKADLVLLRSSSTYLHPRNDTVMQLVLAETGASVTQVMVDGQMIVRDGHVVTVDEDSILASVDHAASSLRRRNQAEWALADRMRPYVRAAARYVSSAVST